MTYTEIVDKLKQSLSIENFAYREFSSGIPKDFQFSSEVVEAEKAKEKALEAWKAHPEYAKYLPEGKSQEHDELREKYVALPYEHTLKSTEWLNSLGIGPIEEIDSYGGEGKGETWWVVLFVPNHNVYIKVDGYYTSYDGTSFDSWEENCSQVEPKEVTITQYHTV